MLPVAGGVLCFGLSLLCVANWYVETSTRGRLFDDLADVPYRHVGLVLGCAPLVADGRPNLYFTGRMDAAADLYKAGKVSRLLVSGDNGSRYYDEPKAMRAALRARGVPDDAILTDDLGLRTLDSVVRAGSLFGVSSLTIVSQSFHNHRAVYIANALGYEACAFNARTVRGRRALRTEGRELLARLRMLADVHLLRRARRQPQAMLPTEM